MADWPDQSADEADRLRARIADLEEQLAARANDPTLPRDQHPLTTDEHAALAATADLWGLLCKVVADGPTRTPDLTELGHHIHAIQHAVLAQAAARHYPHQYRLLGRTLR